MGEREKMISSHLLHGVVLAAHELVAAELEGELGAAPGVKVGLGRSAVCSMRLIAARMFAFNTLVRCSRLTGTGSIAVTNNQPNVVT